MSTTEPPLTAKGDNGQVSFDGTTVTITRKGMRARATTGKTGREIPVSDVSAVMLRSAHGSRSNGYILFCANGRTAQAGVKPRHLKRDPDAVLFNRIHQREFETIRNAVEAAIGGGETEDVYERLRQLGELRDSGVLTDDEFAAKKAALLDRM